MYEKIREKKGKGMRKALPFVAMGFCWAILLLETLEGVSLSERCALNVRSRVIQNRKVIVFSLFFPFDKTRYSKVLSNRFYGFPKDISKSI